MRFIQTISEDGEFSHEIEVDHFDAWNADYTISIVVHHVLKELLRQELSVGYMHIEDVPEQFHEEYESRDDGARGYCPSAYKWLVEEIIWATDPDWEEKNVPYPLPENFQEIYKRRNNAMKLFGKYFFTFWN